MQGEGEERQRLHALDALRGIAALSVLFFHYSVHQRVVIPGDPHLPFAFAWGAYGVFLFFGISGFVITMTLARTRKATDFVMARFARLFPAYWAAMAATALVVMLGGVAALAVPAWVVAANATMLQGFLLIPAMDGVYWTLTVELSFYAGMLLVWRLGLLHRIERVLGGWVALALGWTLWPDLIPWRIALILNLRYIAFFAIGIIIYRFWTGERSGRAQAPLLAFILLAIGIGQGVALLIVAAGTAALLLLVASGRLRWLEWRPLLWLGAISYPFYLVHQNIGYVVMHAVAGQGGGAWLGASLALVIALLLASAISYGVERPALKAIRSWWGLRFSRLAQQSL